MTLLFPLLLLQIFISCKEGKKLYLYSSWGAADFFWNSPKEYIAAYKKDLEKVPQNSVIIDAGKSQDMSVIENKFSKAETVSSFLALSGSQVCVLDSYAADLSPENLKKNIFSLEKINLSSNLYWKNGKTPDSLNRYRLIKAGEFQVGVLAVKLNDPENPEKAAYDGAYKFENPVYETNRNMEKIRKKAEIVILTIENSYKDKKELKKNLSRFIDSLQHKPGLILAAGGPSFTPFKLKGIFIVPPAGKSSTLLRYELALGSALNIRGVSSKELSYSASSPESSNQEFLAFLDKTRKLSDKYFGKNLARTETEIGLEGDGCSPIGSLMALAVKNYIKSNGAVIKNASFKKPLPAGQLKVKNLYETFEDGDNLVYVKIRGEDLKKMAEELDTSRVSFSNLKIAIAKDGTREVYIGDALPEKGKLYRILIPQSLINDKFSVLSHATEFSVLPRTTMDAALWYFRSRSKINPVCVKNYQQEQ